MATVGERWRSLSARARRIWSVLREGAPGLLLVVGFSVSLLAGWYFGSNRSDAIRYTGAVLQVFGLLLVAYELNETRATFGRPTMTSRVRAWIGRLLTSGRPRNIVIAVGTGEIKLSGAAVVAHGSIAGGTLERRVEMLETDIRNLRKETGESASKTREEIGLLRTELSTEVQRRTESDAQVERLLSELAVGGLHLAWVGLVWLVVATLLSAFPDELARLFS